MPKNLVTSYLNLFSNADGNEKALLELLHPDFYFKSPLGEFFSAEQFLKDVRRNVLSIKEIRVQQVLADGEKISALYELVSNYDNIGTLLFSEWFETRDGKIVSIISTYDSSPVRESLSQI